MSQDPPLASLPPDLDPRDAESAKRFLRIFGPKNLASHLEHRARMRNGKPWFAFIDSNGARFFTHFVKLDKVVKNNRSITGSQKFIARNADNFGILF